MLRKKQKLVIFLAVMASVFLMLQTAVNSYSLSERSEIRGTWLTNIDSDILFSPLALEAAINRLERLNFNTLYPTVWQGGYSLYPSQVTAEVYGERVYPGLENRNMLAEVIAKGHEADMRVIPWVEFGFMAPANSALARQHPDWLTQRQDGTQIEVKGEDEVVWLNPFHPEVQQFMLDLVTEIVGNYDVDGIQFDDHLALPVEFGYDNYTRQLYEAERNANPPDKPRETLWVNWRVEQLNQFMGKLFETIKAANPDCVVSVSPNPLNFSLPTSLQDWFTWQEKGYMEELVLQVYRWELDQFISELEQAEVTFAKSQIPVAIGILSGLKHRAMPIEMVSKQVKAVRDRDFDGVSFFFYESLWNWGEKSSQQREEVIARLFLD